MRDLGFIVFVCQNRVFETKKGGFFLLCREKIVYLLSQSYLPAVLRSLAFWHKSFAKICEMGKWLIMSTLSVSGISRSGRFSSQISFSVDFSESFAKKWRIYALKSGVFCLCFSQKPEKAKSEESFAKKF